MWEMPNEPVSEFMRSHFAVNSNSPNYHPLHTHEICLQTLLTLDDVIPNCQAFAEGFVVVVVVHEHIGTVLLTQEAVSLGLLNQRTMPRCRAMIAPQSPPGGHSIGYLCDTLVRFVGKL